MSCRCYRSLTLPHGAICFCLKYMIVVYPGHTHYLVIIHEDPKLGLICHVNRLLAGDSHEISSLKIDK